MFVMIILWIYNFMIGSHYSNVDNCTLVDLKKMIQTKNNKPQNSTKTPTKVDLILRFCWIKHPKSEKLEQTTAYQPSRGALSGSDSDRTIESGNDSFIPLSRPSLSIMSINRQITRLQRCYSSFGNEYFSEHRHEVNSLWNWV